MLEAKGNMLQMGCDALVITSNGFVKSNGDAVMGRGIAKQVSDALPWISGELGRLLRTNGNVPQLLGIHADIDLISYPVKPKTVIFNGNNVVDHAANKFDIGDTVPGYWAKADPELIIKSAKHLVAMADLRRWKTVLVPRFGCGAGELSWVDIKPLVADILDDRFIACTY